MHQEISLLNVSEVCRRVGLSRPSIYRLLVSGQFPTPTYPAPCAPRWRSDEIVNWIDQLSAKRADSPSAHACRTRTPCAPRAELARAQGGDDLPRHGSAATTAHARIRNRAIRPGPPCRGRERSLPEAWESPDRRLSVWGQCPYTVLAIALPIIGVLALNGLLSGEAAALIGSAMGYAFGKDRLGDKEGGDN